MTAHSKLFKKVFDKVGSIKELPILSLIYEEARKAVSKLTDYNELNPENEVEFNEKIDLTEKNIKEILRLFKKAEKARNEFMNEAPKWIECRNETVQIVRNTADEINKDRFNCNVSKITGSVTSTMGLVAGIVSIAVPPAAIVGIPAIVVSSLGGFTVFGTQVTEMTLLNKSLKKAQEVIKKDKEAFKSMMLWFQYSQEIIDLIEGIIGFSLVTEICEKFKILKDGAVIIKEWLVEKYTELSTDLKTFIRSVVELIVKNTDAIISSIPIIVTLLLYFFIFLRRNCVFLFDCAVFLKQIGLGVLKALDVGSDIGLTIADSVAKVGVRATSNAAGRVVALHCLAGFGIALDLINIGFSSYDIHKGSVSEYASKLKELADILENEREMVESIYSKLQSRN